MDMIQEGVFKKSYAIMVRGNELVHTAEGTQRKTHYEKPDLYNTFDFWIMYKRKKGCNFSKSTSVLFVKGTQRVSTLRFHIISLFSWSNQDLYFHKFNNQPLGDIIARANRLH